MAIYALESKVAYLYVDFMFIVLSWRGADKLKKLGQKSCFSIFNFCFISYTVHNNNVFL